MDLNEIIKKWVLKNGAACICIAITFVLLVVIDWCFKEFFSENPSLHAVMCSVVATGLVGLATPNLKKTIDKKILKESIKKSLRPTVHNLDKGIANVEAYLSGKNLLPRDKKLDSYMANAKSPSTTLVDFVK